MLALYVCMFLQASALFLKFSCFSIRGIWLWLSAASVPDLFVVDAELDANCLLILLCYIPFVCCCCCVASHLFVVAAVLHATGSADSKTHGVFQIDNTAVLAAQMTLMVPYPVCSDCFSA
jgi:hypothetical protein